MRAAVFLLAWAAIPALAQQSASFKVEEHVLNAGGTPTRGSVPSSAGFRVTLSAIGDPAARRGMSSTSFRSDAGFIVAYTPPGEVTALRFGAEDANLEWDPEAAAGDYALYRDTLASLSGLAYGACLLGSLAVASASDLTSPAPGEGFFYLVTVRNRLREEGSKGFRTGGIERGNAAPCP